MAHITANKDLQTIKLSCRLQPHVLHDDRCHVKPCIFHDKKELKINSQIDFSSDFQIDFSIGFWNWIWCPKISISDWLLDWFYNSLQDWIFDWFLALINLRLKKSISIEFFQSRSLWVCRGLGESSAVSCHTWALGYWTRSEASHWCCGPAFGESSWWNWTLGSYFAELRCSSRGAIGDQGHGNASNWEGTNLQPDDPMVSWQQVWFAGAVLAWIFAQMVHQYCIMSWWKIRGLISEWWVSDEGTGSLSACHVGSPVPEFRLTWFHSSFLMLW